MSAHTPLFSGSYRHGPDEVTICIRSCGEAWEVASLSASDEATCAFATDEGSVASVFAAPRTGTDRYPDWARFEWGTRQTRNSPPRRRVWRIAEDRDWALFLGQASPDRSDVETYPLAAALWRGWCRSATAIPVALLWPADVRAHVWLVTPGKMPLYFAVAGRLTPDAVMLLLDHHTDTRRLALDLGGTSTDFEDAARALFPGPVRRTEPFGHLRVDEALRPAIQSHRAPDLFLPALGAALARAEGAPAVWMPCESSLEVAADDA